ncbi:MAG: hypothetical protein QOH90_473 [Actinomycetota bacterium]|nr:hypothetical protein [Actinomycetota bacterium]
MVASAMGIPIAHIEVTADGDLDLRGTLGVDRDVPVGFQDIRLHLRIDAPEAGADDLEKLAQKTQQYCVVLQTLQRPPLISVDW